MSASDFVKTLCEFFVFKSPPRVGNFFPLPNEIFNMDLCAGEIALYSYLMRMEDRKTYSCYTSFLSSILSSNSSAPSFLSVSVRAILHASLLLSVSTIPSQRQPTCAVFCGLCIIPSSFVSKTPIARSFPKCFFRYYDLCWLLVIQPCVTARVRRVSFLLSFAASQDLPG